MRVQLGCGHKPWSGWVNIDCDRAREHADLVADLRTLPIESETVETAVAIHVLEHFYEWEAVPVLTEWRRILKPGGRLVLELPCMDKLIAYLVTCTNQNKPVFAHMSWWALWGDPRYESPEMIHKWGYSIEMLKAKLTEVGFSTMTFETPRYHIRQRDMRVVAVK